MAASASPTPIGFRHLIRGRRSACFWLRPGREPVFRAGLNMILSGARRAVARVIQFDHAREFEETDSTIGI